MSTPRTHLPNNIKLPFGALTGVLDDSSPAQTEADKMQAERLIRTTALNLANGAPIKDLDGLVSRNVGNLTHADVKANRLNTNVLGDIITTVEQAKGAAPFNWNSATPDQIKAYLNSKGLNHLFGTAGMDGLGRMAEGGSASGSDRSGRSTNPQTAKWEREGVPLSNTTGLNTGVYAQLRGEGYSATQIGAAAGDLKNIRGFTSADVTKYTPYFVETDKKFRAEAKSVIESNGKKRFSEDSSLTNALPQTVLSHDGKIQPYQMNSLGQALDALQVDPEALRKQHGEAAKHQYMIKNYNFDKNEYLKLKTPEERKDYIEKRGGDRSKIVSQTASDFNAPPPDLNAGFGALMTGANSDQQSASTPSASPQSGAAGMGTKGSPNTTTAENNASSQSAPKSDDKATPSASTGTQKAPSQVAAKSDGKATPSASTGTQTAAENQSNSKAPKVKMAGSQPSVG